LIGVSEMLLRDEKDIYVGDFAGGKKRVPVADVAPRLLLHVVRDTGSYHAPCRQPPPKEVFNLAVVLLFFFNSAVFISVGVGGRGILWRNEGQKWARN